MHHLRLPLRNPRPSVEVAQCQQTEKWSFEEVKFCENDPSSSTWMLFLRDVLHYAIENDETELFKGLKKWRAADWNDKELAGFYPNSLRFRLASFLETGIPFRYPGSIALDTQVIQGIIASGILSPEAGALRPFLIQVWKLLFPGRELYEATHYSICVKQAKQNDWRWVNKWLEDVEPGKDWVEDTATDSVQQEKLQNFRTRVEKSEAKKSQSTSRSSQTRQHRRENKIIRDAFIPCK